jgi:hypothetical protein
VRNIAAAFVGMAVAISMMGLSVTEPAVAKARKGCGSQQQLSQTGECNDVIVENLDRGPSSNGHFYRSSQKAKKHTPRAGRNTAPEPVSER